MHSPCRVQSCNCRNPAAPCCNAAWQLHHRSQPGQSSTVACAPVPPLSAVSVSVPMFRAKAFSSIAYQEQPSLLPSVCVSVYPSVFFFHTLAQRIAAQEANYSRDYIYINSPSWDRAGVVAGAAAGAGQELWQSQLAACHALLYVAIPLLHFYFAASQSDSANRQRERRRGREREIGRV